MKRVIAIISPGKKKKAERSKLDLSAKFEGGTACHKIKHVI